MRFNFWLGLLAMVAGIVVTIALHPVPGVLLIIGGTMIMVESR